jgi:hypothetical protein
MNGDDPDEYGSPDSWKADNPDGSADTRQSFANPLFDNPELLLTAANLKADANQSQVCL